MHEFAIPLLQGLLTIFAISGVGRLALWPFSGTDLRWYWYLVFVMLAGQSAASILVQAVLLGGIGSAQTLRHLAWILIVAAIVGNVFAPRIRASGTIVRAVRENKLPAALLVTAWLTNLVVALAPSTKIDELYYHMLTPRRILEDGGLRFYQLPLESATVPHMHYQIALSVAHAVGAPDAGNILSWAFSLALGIFLAGFLADATRQWRFALWLTSLCSVGLYATVWHTTGGAHALGDLAMVVAIAGVLRPQALMPEIGTGRYTLALATAASVAASTKLSLWPLALVVSVLIVWRAAEKARDGCSVSLLAGLAALPWMVIHLPLMIWTYWASRSFWGPVFANVFGPSVFSPALLQDLRNARSFDPSSALSMLRYAIVELSPVFFIAVPWLFWSAFRGYSTSRLAATLFLFQASLVAWKFRFDFRFLGGLEYAAVLAAALTLAEGKDSIVLNSNNGPPESGLWANRLGKLRSWALCAIAVPWLGAQIYYARPFASVTSGWTTREQFLERYVALTRDFAILDRMLPGNAVLYMPDGRLPNFYAPRPVVLTLLDLRGREPIYRLTLEPAPAAEVIDEKSRLNCAASIYSNDRAVVETYRTPGRNSMLGRVTVQECRIETGHLDGSLDSPPETRN